MNGNAGARVVLDASDDTLVSSSGAVLLGEAARLAGLPGGLSSALARWRARRAVHDPGKVLLDVAMTIALGGDCVSDIAVVRAQPSLFGSVASDPTISRLIGALAADADEAVQAIRDARAAARARVWAAKRPLAGSAGSYRGGQVIVDLDTTLVTAYSAKQGARQTYKKSFGFAPLCAFVDHGQYGSGEVLSIALRPGNSSPWSSEDHLAILQDALHQLPEHERQQVLIRADTAACSRAFLGAITDAGLQYSIGFQGHDTVRAALQAIPPQAWRAVRDRDGQARPDAQVAELTGWMPPPKTRPQNILGRPDRWPAGMRIIARRELPTEDLQLRISDDDGWRVTCFATNTRGPGWTLDALETRHRERARCEDRIRCLKDTGLRNLPFHTYAQNKIWVEIVALAHDLLTWMQTLAFTRAEPARRWEPKRLRLTILAVAGRIVRTGRRRRLRLPRDWPWTPLITTGWHTLRTS